MIEFNGNWYEKGDEVVYLIKVEYKNRTLLKIGYASDIESRLKSYELHNPDFTLIGLRKGTRVLESLMHKYFSNYRLPHKEWFIYCNEIFNKFYLITENGYLDKEILKQNIREFFWHNPTERLIDIYLENYKFESESKKVGEAGLSRIMSYMINLLDSYINLYLEHLDYSKITSKLSIKAEYVFLFSNPFSPDKYLEINLDQLFRCNPIVINNKRSKETIKIELKNKEFYSITNLFAEYQESKMDETIKKIEKIDALECSKIKYFSNLLFKNYSYDYFDLVDDSEELIINDSIVILEQWAFDIIKKFGFKMDLS